MVNFIAEPPSSHQKAENTLVPFTNNDRGEKQTGKTLLIERALCPSSLHPWREFGGFPEYP
jgi:hypothetical protein